MTDQESRAKRDLLDALERLKAGHPTELRLVERAIRGKLRINPLTVSIEAGRSRTLIGMPDCMSPDVRELVLAERNRSVDYRVRVSDVLAAKAQVRELLEKIRTKDSALAAAFLRIDYLESRLREYGVEESKIRPIRGKQPSHQAISP